MNAVAYTGVLGLQRTPAAWLRPRRILATLDSTAAALAFLLAYALLPLRAVDQPNARLAHGLTLILIAAVLLILLFRDGQYSASRRLSRVPDTFALAKNLILAYLLVMGLSFASKGFFTGYGGQSRLIVFSDLGLLFLLMFVARLAVRHYQLALFARGEHLRRVIVVGAGQAAADFASFLEKRPWLGVQCVGSIGVNREGREGLETREGRRVRSLGSLVDAERVLRETEAGEVVVALDPQDLHLLPTVSATLKAEGLPFRVVPSLFEESYRQAKLAGFAELPVVDMAVDPLDRVQRTFKRALDLTLAGAVLFFGGPILFALAALIKLTSPGPVLFEQERVGKNGQHFMLLKFRTMYQDAEERLAELRDQNEAQGHIFKMKDDPRVTPVGRLLRKFSLDEFPQFLNVLSGEMSVVGPRPPLPREVECYETAHFSRLKGPPGITGLWQVSGRSNLTFEEMVKLDRYYLENWSTGLDLEIMLKTVYVMLARKGAW